MGDWSLAPEPTPTEETISSALFGTPSVRAAATLSALGAGFSLVELGAVLAAMGLTFAVTGSVLGGVVTVTVVSVVTGAVVLVVGLAMIGFGVFTIVTVAPATIGSPEPPVDLDPMQFGPLVGVRSDLMFASNVVTDLPTGFALSKGQVLNTFFQAIPIAQFRRHLSDLSYFGTVPTEPTTGFGVGPGGAPGVAGVDSGTGNTPGGTPGGAQSP